ncbi:conjugative transfer protein MobI(A/C) [Hydrogenophaga defluvii]|uniref:Conjugative transfer protein MobI(A/C) n=1 Tax=Hydrogenophaga defluvii TaxID=249410 RepID=A0ABW2SGJ7_9BURK
MDLVPTSEQRVYAAAMAALEACIADLYDQAVDAAEDYMRHVDTNEAKAKGWAERSNLQLSCTRKGNHLDLKWTGIRWYGGKNDRQNRRHTIPKNKETQAYSTAKLLEYSKDWEKDVVLETERKLQIIRRKAAHFVKAIIAMRHVHQIVTMSQSMEKSDESGNDDA